MLQHADLIVDIQESEVVSPGTEEVGSRIVSKHDPILGERERAEMEGGGRGRGEKEWRRREEEKEREKEWRRREEEKEREWMVKKNGWVEVLRGGR